VNSDLPLIDARSINHRSISHLAGSVTLKGQAVSPVAMAFEQDAGNKIAGGGCEDGGIE
jgi:hypothetical protein